MTDDRAHKTTHEELVELRERVEELEAQNAHLRSVSAQANQTEDAMHDVKGRLARIEAEMRYHEKKLMEVDDAITELKQHLYDVRHADHDGLLSRLLGGNK